MSWDLVIKECECRCNWLNCLEKSNGNLVFSSSVTDWSTMKIISVNDPQGTSLPPVPEGSGGNCRDTRTPGSPGPKTIFPNRSEAPARAAIRTFQVIFALGASGLAAIPQAFEAPGGCLGSALLGARGWGAVWVSGTVPSSPHSLAFIARAGIMVG